jgi:hypothetical protein
VHSFCLDVQVASSLIALSAQISLMLMLNSGGGRHRCFAGDIILLGFYTPRADAEGVFYSF